MLQEESLSIDRLEDELIDHPDACTKKDLDDSLDETFQKKLNARAEQIASQFSSNKSNGSEKGAGKRPNEFLERGSSNYSFLITKYHLNYNFEDLQKLGDEIKEWFVYHDFRILGGLDTLPSVFNNSKVDEQEGSLDLVKRSVKSIREIDDLSDSRLFLPVKIVTYFAFGEYSQFEDRTSQTKQIHTNINALLNLNLQEQLTTLLLNFINSEIKGKDKLSVHSHLSPEVESCYFSILTIFYFMLNVILLEDESKLIEFQDLLYEVNILPALIRLVEYSKWKPSNSLRIRNVLFLIRTLLLVELGDSEHNEKCKDFISEIHGLKRNKDQTSNLNCSVLDYFTFKEDLLDKFPMLQKDDIGESVKACSPSLGNSKADSFESIDSDYQYFMAINNYSSSFTNFIETPQPSKAHTVFSQLPSQTLHIATPAPSPPSTPSEYMTGGEKIRKSYQLHQGMPFIYPNDNNGEVPLAIKEAEEILKKSINIKYSDKCLWNERQRFMSQERGCLDGYQEKDDEFDYDEELIKKHPSNSMECRSIVRTERLYGMILPQLHTLVSVLLDTIKANRFDYNLNFAEWELNPETSCLNHDGMNDEETKFKIHLILLQQLEVLNAKEITLKASTSIISLLLNWFKTNHALKYYYLSSLLFDHHIFDVVYDYLNKSFNNSNLKVLNDKKKEDDLTDYETGISQNKLINPQIELPTFDFFNNCMNSFPENFTYKLINKTSLQNLEYVVDSQNIKNIYINDFNHNYCFIMKNLLDITNKILARNTTQRILSLNELKPSELLKMILIHYDTPCLSDPILKIFKKLIPYQGRKWKSLNMELISQVYLRMKLDLKDDWLSGRDLEKDFNNSFDQEIALRSLLQFYNMRKYKTSMEELGYTLSDDDDLDIPSLNITLNSVDG